jgi:hypothetical protein
VSGAVRNPQPIDDKRLDEIEARANAATAPPWTYRYQHNGVTGGEDAFLIEAPPYGTFPDTPAWRETFRAGRIIGRSSGDCQFIANSREDVPDLVAEVRRLRAFIGGLYA